MDSNPLRTYEPSGVPGFNACGVTPSRGLVMGGVAAAARHETDNKVITKRAVVLCISTLTPP